MRSAMCSSMRCAISTKNVLVVRPQPGQALTCGRNERRPSDWRTCIATRTSSVRSPPGCGVSDTRIVSPMPVGEQDRRGPRSRRPCPSCPCRPRSGRGGAGSRSGARARGRPSRGRRTPLTFALMMMRSWPRPVASASSAERRADCSIASIVTSRASSGSGRRAFSSIRVVRRSWSSEPQFTPMRTGLSCSSGDPDDRDEVLVAPLRADVARVDAVLRERGRRARVLGQELVAVVVEVADERDADPEVVELAPDDRDGARRGIVVDRHAHELAARVRERRDLERGRVGVGRVGVRHRLHDDRGGGADGDAADVDEGRRASDVPDGRAHPTSRPMSCGGHQRAGP